MFEDPYELRTKLMEDYNLTLKDVYGIENVVADRLEKLSDDERRGVEITLTVGELDKFIAEYSKDLLSLLEETSEFKKFCKTGHASTDLDNILLRKEEIAERWSKRIFLQLVLPCVTRQDVNEGRLYGGSKLLEESDG